MPSWVASIITIIRDLRCNDCMVLLMKTKSVYVLFFVLLFSWTGASVNVLIKKIGIDEKGRGFFKRTTDFVVADDKLIIADFFGNNVLSFDYSESAISFSHFIGHPGQGPGDLQKPFALSADHDRVAVKDQESISVFNANGTFLQKFKQFSKFISFLLLNDRIYYCDSNPISKKLISIYDLKGNLISSIVEKRLPARSGELGALSGFREKLLYDGVLLSDGKCLYFVSRYFGFVEKYSMSGELLLTSSPLLEHDDNTKAKLAVNKRELLDSADLKLENGRPRCLELFLDCCSDGEYAYILMTQFDAIERKPIPQIDIRRINLSDLRLSHSYSLEIGNDEWLSHLRVKKSSNGPIFIIDLRSASEEGLFELHPAT